MTLKGLVLGVALAAGMGSCAVAPKTAYACIRSGYASACTLEDGQNITSYLERGLLGSDGKRYDVCAVSVSKVEYSDLLVLIDHGCDRAVDICSVARNRDHHIMYREDSPKEFEKYDKQFEELRLYVLVGGK